MLKFILYLLLHCFKLIIQEVGIATLAEKSKSYIQHQKGRTEKDPSASLPETDGAKDDSLDNR